MQKLSLLKCEVYREMFYNEKYGLPDYEREECILFQVDNEPVVIMNPEGVEYAIDMVEWDLLKDEKPLLEFDTADAEEAITQIFKKENYLNYAK